MDSGADSRASLAADRSALHADSDFPKKPSSRDPAISLSLSLSLLPSPLLSWSFEVVWLARRRAGPDKMEVIESAERIKFLLRLTLAQTSRGPFLFPRLCRDMLVSSEKLQIERACSFNDERMMASWRDPYAIFPSQSTLMDLWHDIASWRRHVNSVNTFKTYQRRNLSRACRRYYLECISAS